jgi:hypothetical protein
MPGNGTPLGDVLAGSGYSHRVPGNWAAPLRAAGAPLVQDLHPHDRGPKGTHAGAVIANGSLYCPVTPRTLLELGPPSRSATPEQAAGRDAKTAEAARCKLGRLTAGDEDGYHRAQCPAAAGKVRCPLKPPSMTLDRDRPEILQPPEHPQACCTQQTVTVSPDVLAKTAQKHDYPSAAWRRSYARRTAAERIFATVKDPAASDTARGWCRLTASRPSPCSQSPCSPSATSGSSPPGTHAKTKTPAAPPEVCPRNPQAPPQNTRHGTPLTASARSTATSHTQLSASMPAHARHPPGTAKMGAYGAPNQPGLARNHTPTETSDPNVKIDLTET